MPLGETTQGFLNHFAETNQPVAVGVQDLADVEWNLQPWRVARRPCAASAFPSGRSRGIAWFCWTGAGRTDRPLRLSWVIAIAYWSWLPLVVALGSSMVFRTYAIGPVLYALVGNPDAKTNQMAGEIAFFAAPVRHRNLCQPPPLFGPGRDAQHSRFRDGVSGRYAVAMNGPLA